MMSVRMLRSGALSLTRCQDADRRGSWGGALSRKTGYVGHVTADDAWAACTRAALPQAAAAYECVFTAPRSWSVFWGLSSTERVHHAMDRAYETAIEDALEYTQDNISYTRRGANGVSQIDATGLLWAKFTHSVGRFGGPDRHCHVLIGGQVLGSDGNWGPLDARVLSAATVAIDARFEATLEHTTVRYLRKIGERISFDDRPGRDGERGTREIIGIPDELLDERALGS